VLESGAVNAAYLLAYLIVLQSGSHGLEIMASIATPLIGIIYSVVIIRATQSSKPYHVTPRSARSQHMTPVTTVPMFKIQREAIESENTTFTQRSDSEHVGSIGKPEGDVDAVFGTKMLRVQEIA
jgi:hypothetical protein